MHKLSKQTAQWARQKQKKDGLADVLTKKLSVRAFERLGDAVEPLPWSANQFYPNKEQNDRADDRQDETRRMK